MTDAPHTDDCASGRLPDLERLRAYIKDGSVPRVIWSTVQHQTKADALAALDRVGVLVERIENLARAVAGVADGTPPRQELE